MRVVFVLGILTVLASQEDRIVPVHQEPRHRLVYDSPGTRILDIQIPPGDTTLFHTHSDPILYVNISSSRMRNQTLGGEWNTPSAPNAPSAPSGPSAPSVVPTTPPGRVMSTTSYAEQPVTHRVNNIGTSLYRLIGMTNASAGDASTDASADFDGTPELTNRWFRAYRRELTGEIPEHRHRNPVVVVLAAGTVRIHFNNSGIELLQPGAFRFVEPEETHTLVAPASGAQVMEVEIRRPR